VKGFLVPTGLSGPGVGSDLVVNGAGRHQETAFADEEGPRARRTSTASGLRAGRREWIGLAVLARPLLVALDIGALFLALPHLSSDLQATSAQQYWISDIYGFMLPGS
jgi:hypothetical protein